MRSVFLFSTTLFTPPSGVYMDENREGCGLFFSFSPLSLLLPLALFFRLRNYLYTVKIRFWLAVSLLMHFLCSPQVPGSFCGDSLLFTFPLFSLFNCTPSVALVSFLALVLYR